MGKYRILKSANQVFGLIIIGRIDHLEDFELWPIFVSFLFALNTVSGSCGTKAEQFTAKS